MAQLATAAALALLLAACGSSTLMQPSVETASTVRESANTPESAAPPRVQRRGRNSEDPEAMVADVPENAMRSYERALAAMGSGDWTEAELELEQLVLEYDDFPGPFVNLAIVLMHSGHDDEALVALENALALNPTHAAANNQLGMLLRRQGQFDAAEAAYRRAIESDPLYEFAYYNLGVLLDLYLRRQAEALEYYEDYQNLLAEPNQQVGRWIIDLRRRLGITDDAARVAQGDGT